MGYGECHLEVGHIGRQAHVIGTVCQAQQIRAQHGHRRDGGAYRGVRDGHDDGDRAAAVRRGEQGTDHDQASTEWPGWQDCAYPVTE